MSPKKTKSKKKYTCHGCPATCCHDLAMMITKPQTKEDLEELEWYLRYDTVNIFIRSYKWYLLIKGRCIYLNKKNRCTIYDKRPARCRLHPSDDCERHGEYYDTLITTPEELEQHLNKKKGKKKPKRK